jgi:hypothetical protein
VYQTEHKLNYNVDASACAAPLRQLLHCAEASAQESLNT